jgi:hypothetical protein
MEQTPPVVESPEPSSPEQSTPEPAAPLSIREHVREYDPQRDKTDDAPASSDPQPPLAADAPPAERAAHHSEQQRREKQTGKFTDGRKRGKDAVERIGQLTGRAKTAEERLAAAEAEIAQLRASPRPAPPAPQTQAPPAPQQAAPPAFQPRRAFDPRDPEPKEADFGGDPMKFLDARFEWLARATYRHDQQQAHQHQQVMQRSIAWGARVEKAMEKHADYAEIAFQPVPWTDNSPIDQFIDGDDNGAEVLYYLQSNPAERDAVLRLPVIQQMKHLSLLSQRFDASPQSATPGGTGSGAPQKIRYLAPRPPNPVRTEPQRAEKSAAPLDGSLGIRAHAKSFHPR